MTETAKAGTEMNDRMMAAAVAMERTPRIVEDSQSDASEGRLVWAPKKSLWWVLVASGTVAAPFYATWGAVMLFVITLTVTICFGHSLGMHRRLIHNAFDCPVWLERIFAYLGTLVSMGGPKGMIRQHDLRDWAQRKPDCHPFLSHKASMVVDITRQLHFNLVLQNPPQVVFEPNVEDDRLYRFFDRYLLSQQLPWAILFYAIGGIPWVLWGICVRCAVSLTGHWLVVHLAHNHGVEDWHVEGAGVQGSNVPYASWLTWGESYHNNHHAFPGSAVMALEEGQTDPGWWVLRQLERCGLVWNLQNPGTLPERDALRRLHRDPIIMSKHDMSVVVNKL